MNPFAEWIAKAGLTKHDVAEAWGVQDTAIWKICRNGHRITSDTALRIWRFTGGAVTLDQLLLDGTEMPDKSEEHQAALQAIRDARARAAQKRKEKINAERKKKRKPRAEAGRAEQRLE
jgi:plasmid maintenance system antidote protein VapI